MLVETYNKDGQQTGQIDLQDDIFAVEPNESAMHQAVKVYLAHQRQGTHKTKSKWEVSGGGKKPWKQKGRGTARSGSTRSPIWVGGGTIHGPLPHTYDLKITKKLNKLARKSAVSLRVSENNLVVVDDFSLEEIKTKQIAEILKNLKIENESVLILLPDNDYKMYLSARNIPRLTVHPVDKISCYDILNHKKLLLFKGAVETLVNAFTN